MADETGTDSRPQRVIIMGAGGRDFHNFNMVFRDNSAYNVVGFTAAQIPGIAGRTYPSSLAGALYPDGIPIYAEDDLEVLISRERVDWVYFAYSDLPHVEVMHKASRVLAAGASFGLIGPDQTMLRPNVPVISVCAVRTGAGKSPLSQLIASWLRGKGHKVSVIRHPMPYGDLEGQAVQKFTSFSDLEKAEVTFEEREEYEPYVQTGVGVYAGVDYRRILELAEMDSDIVLWDGGNNDFPFIKPDLHLVVVDPHRAGHEILYHPGEVNFRMADAYVLTKIDSAPKDGVEQVLKNISSMKPDAPVVMADLEIIVDRPELIKGGRVVVVGDGPTLTHGGMGFGAGTLAARSYGALEIVDPRPYAIGEIKDTFAAHPHLEGEIPAMGYTDAQIRDLETTVNNVPADIIVDATPVALSRRITTPKPIVNVDYRFKERGEVLEQLLERFVAERLR